MTQSQSAVLGASVSTTIRAVWERGFEPDVMARYLVGSVGAGTVAKGVGIPQEAVEDVAKGASVPDEEAVERLELLFATAVTLDVRQDPNGDAPSPARDFLGSSNPLLGDVKPVELIATGGFEGVIPDLDAAVDRYVGPSPYVRPVVIEASL